MKLKTLFVFLLACLPLLSCKREQQPVVDGPDGFGVNEAAASPYDVREEDVKYKAFALLIYDKMLELGYI